MLNRVILIGRLTADPELKHIGQENIPMCKFCIAVDRRFKNQDGEKETDFINCTAWRKTAELISQYVKKGHRLAVEGTLQQDRWETKEGEKRSTYSVQIDNFAFLESARQNTPAENLPATPEENDDDSLPF